MTLLEGILATVLLAVVAVACLDGTRGAAQLQQRSSARAEAIVAAATALEAATVDAGADAGAASSRDAVSVQRSTYRAPVAFGERMVRAANTAALLRIDVEVTLRDGGRVQVSRLVEAPRAVTVGTAGAPR